MIRTSGHAAAASAAVACFLVVAAAFRGDDLVSTMLIACQIQKVSVCDLLYNTNVDRNTRPIAQRLRRRAIPQRHWPITQR